MRRTVKKTFPEDESMRLRSRPMRRHHYLYGRNRYLSNPAVLAGLASLHRKVAAGQARELRLMDPEGPASWTHPDLGRMLYSDGKVVTRSTSPSPVMSGSTRRRARSSSGATSRMRTCTVRGAASAAHASEPGCLGA